MVRKSLGVDLVPHPRRKVGRKRPNALASQRLVIPRTPPLASQKGLKRMATRQTRTKFHKTSKSTQTTLSSVRFDCCSPFRVSHPFPCKDAIMNPSAALQSTVEDFLDSLKETPGAAQAELVNCILRACGCNETVNEDEAVDYDGVVDSLDNFTESLKQVRSRQTRSLSFQFLTFIRMTLPYIRLRQGYPYSRDSASPCPNSSNVSSFQPPSLVLYIRLT
jgi:hypothetical protein